VDVVTFPKEEKVWIAPISQKTTPETFHGIKQQKVQIHAGEYTAA
jgi:hypothetical protein